MSKKGTNKNFIINDNITKTITLNLQEFSLIQSNCEDNLLNCKIDLHRLKMHGNKNTDYLDKSIFIYESIIRKIKETSFDKL